MGTSRPTSLMNIPVSFGSLQQIAKNQMKMDPSLPPELEEDKYDIVTE